MEKTFLCVHILYLLNTVEEGGGAAVTLSTWILLKKFQ